ncbi:MAG TPA: LamG-like jellyroll fold domain-containing protein, partial [Candidatus Dormibacteraeota bacterium]|nr:LamG-like jellyroll fold domain-containing protein [Candidatus Dormibacteraeota bacterium]
GTAFQWRKNGAVVAGATTAIYLIANASTNDSGRYSVRVANSAGAVVSDPADLVITPAPVFATYTEAILADNPVHYYPLDDTAGTTATDLGSLATGGGTYTGGITLGQPAITSRLGRAAKFDGAPGTFVDLGLFHVGDTLTVEAWASLDPAANNNPAFHAIVARWDGSYELDFAPGDFANLVVRNNNNVFGLAAGPTPSARGQWHHLVGVFADGVLTVYVDGVKGSEQNIGGTLQDAGPAPDRVLIGGTRSGTVASFNFRGLIDEVALYDTALSAAQIRGHFRAAVPSGPPVLTIQKAVLLTWPAFPPNYVLQTASAINGPYANYAGEPPTLQGGTNKLT